MPWGPGFLSVEPGWCHCEGYRVLAQKGPEAWLTCPYPQPPAAAEPWGGGFRGSRWRSDSSVNCHLSPPPHHTHQGLPGQGSPSRLPQGPKATRCHTRLPLSLCVPSAGPDPGFCQAGHTAVGACLGPGLDVEGSASLSAQPEVKALLLLRSILCVCFSVFLLDLMLGLGI